jgi:hypothetical protein
LAWQLHLDEWEEEALLVVVIQTNNNYQMCDSPPANHFPMDRFPFPFVREFIDRNGGQAAFEGLTTDLNLQHGDTKGCECVCGFACHFSRPQNKAVRWAMQHKDLLFLFFLCRPKHAVILCCQCAAFECSKKHGEHGNDEHES